MKKTLPIRALESAGVHFEPLEQSRKEYSAEGVAADLDVKTAQVLKAMVVRFTNVERPSPAGSFALFIAPGDRRLSMKKIADCLGDKNADLASERDVERITGFKVGSVSVLGLRREETMRYIDQAVLEIEQVIISAGRPDYAIRLKPEALMKAIGTMQIGDYCE